MNVWPTAAELLVRQRGGTLKLDGLLEALPIQITAVERRRIRHLVYGTIRHRALLEYVVTRHMRHPPRPLLRETLLLGAFELLEAPESAPAIVHHAVEHARNLTSPAEARLVNAVLRRVPESLRAILDLAPQTVDEMALRHSHPAWLVERWSARWGEKEVGQLLEWNQQPAAVHARIVGPQSQDLPPSFVSAPWPGFFRLERPDWDDVERLLAAGRIYLQDPATAIAPGLLAVNAGEIVLDLCAAPGGKTLQLAERVGASGHVLAIDLPGARLERLRQNLARYANLPVTVFAGDATAVDPATLANANLPAAFDAVLIDVPCSNTGVLRHRVDAKWRLQPRDIMHLPRLQLSMLRHAAALVRPGGRLVYSTCSLEPEENEQVVAQFLSETAVPFTLERSEHSLPWQTGHDGAGAILLRRAGALAGATSPGCRSRRSTFQSPVRDSS